MASTNHKTIAFFGASGGCGLSALKHSLAAGHTCIALCRTPAKLEAVFKNTPNLVVKQGNAHSEADVAACLTVPGDGARLVDLVCFSIGSPFHMSKMKTDDPDVCKKGMAALLSALGNLREGGAQGRPRILAISTVGISKCGRDVPVATLPIMAMLKVPHEDKKVMEEAILASAEEWVIVRPQLLKDGESNKRIKVGIEDPVKGIESKDGVGYAISREDTGRWMAENLILTPGDQYLRKMVTITY
jgi:nucleoside-diphosphate-sugar epimerase